MEQMLLIYGVIHGSEKNETKRLCYLDLRGKFIDRLKTERALRRKFNEQTHHFVVSHHALSLREESPGVKGLEQIRNSFSLDTNLWCKNVVTDLNNTS